MPVKQLQTIEDSYSSLLEAFFLWKKKRQENKRLIVNGHVTKLLNISKIKIESAKEIRLLTDNLLSQLRALKQLRFENNNLSETVFINTIL